MGIINSYEDHGTPGFAISIEALQSSAKKPCMVRSGEP